MKHWITDLRLYDEYAWPDSGGVPKGAWYLFHFLRLLAWKIIAECDNTSITANSHIPDGCMDDPGVANWTVVGTATRAKSDVCVYAGYRSLTFTTVATGDGVQSAVFTSMEVSQAYVLSLWAWNDSGHQLKVYVNNGSGSFVLAGVIPDNAGTWTRYQFSYTSHSTVTACRFKIVDEDGTVGAGQVYIDSVSTTRSWFEARIRGSGIDGVIESGNNKFSSASYVFTDSDISAGREVCFVDLVTEGNSGIFKVIGRDGTKAILDIRDDGTTFLAPAAALAFRVLDRTDIPSMGLAAGFCLESPHSTKWRWKYRHCYLNNGGQKVGTGRWGASPEDCALNVDTFQFYKEQRSTARNMAPDTASFLGDYFQDAHGYYGGKGSWGTPSRFYAVTDGETYITSLHRILYPAASFIGFLGDNYRPFDDTFVLMMEYNFNEVTNGDTLHFLNTTKGWASNGCGFGLRGLAVRACVASAGFGTSTEVTEYMANAKANPWSGKESIRPFSVFLDYDGVVGEFAVIESTNHDFGHCRSNLTVWNPFGASKEWFHSKSGLCIAWHGRGVQP